MTLIVLFALTQLYGWGALGWLWRPIGDAIYRFWQLRKLRKIHLIQQGRQEDEYINSLPPWKQKQILFARMQRNREEDDKMLTRLEVLGIAVFIILILFWK